MHIVYMRVSRVRGFDNRQFVRLSANVYRYRINVDRGVVNCVRGAVESLLLVVIFNYIEQFIVELIMYMSYSYRKFRFLLRGRS